MHGLKFILKLTDVVMGIFKSIRSSKVILAAIPSHDDPSHGRPAGE
jgi:hypothetical protein